MAEKIKKLALVEDDRKAYERREDETGPAWDCFVAYLKQGNTRSVLKTARAMQKARTTVNDWCNRYDWKRRALAYDRENDAAERRAELAAIEEMRKRHLENAMLLQSIGKTEFEKIREHAENQGALALPPKLSLEFYESGAAQERLNRGEPSEITQTIEEPAIDLKGFDLKELEVLRAVHLKLKKKENGGDDESEDYDE